MCMKACVVYVELHVKEVSCPGVWLCPNGEVILKLHMFGDTFSTAALNPEFPLRYQETFTFRKVFRPMRHLSDLQQQLKKEEFYSELIQSNDKRSVALATYETSALELLFPSPINKALIAGVDVDLLMVATRYFPGILGPKIEISTKTTIEEAVTSDSSSRKFAIINPRMLCSKSSKPDSENMACSRVYLPLSPKKHECRTKIKCGQATTPCYFIDNGTEGEVKSDVLSALRDHPTDKTRDNENSALQHKKCSCEVCTAYHRYFGDMQTNETFQREKFHYSNPMKVQSCLCRHCYGNYSHPRYIQTTRWSPDSISDDKTYREKFYNNLHDFYQKLYSGIKGSSNK